MTYLRPTITSKIEKEQRLQLEFDLIRTYDYNKLLLNKNLRLLNKELQLTLKHILIKN